MTTTPARDRRDLMQGELRWLALPRPDQPQALPYRPYWTGHAWQMGTAAYWESVAAEMHPIDSHRLGNTFAEEVGACLLGGHGMPFWLAQAAYEHLRDAGVFGLDENLTVEEIEKLLRAPLSAGGSTRRYRFPRQRAIRLADALAAIRSTDLPRSDKALRDWLLTISGIGPKTASWIVRNHRASNDVAIVDIHVVRAGIVAGLFNPQWRLPRDYDLYETAFLGWAQHADLPASNLDACIWGVLAHDGDAARDILGVERLQETPKPIWLV